MDSTPLSYDKIINLTDGFSYKFKVNAFNKLDVSSFSNEARAIVLSNPYKPKGGTYKGAIHLHTTNSDGKRTPDEVATAYKDAGYDFIVISDHDFLTTFSSGPGILTINGVEENALTGEILAINTNRDNDSKDPQTIISESVSSGLQYYVILTCLLFLGHLMK